MPYKPYAGTPGGQNGTTMTTTKEYTFRIGDPVWAKMKGHPAWPGKIDMPLDGMKRPTIKKVMHCVFFFGTHDYGWITDVDLKPFQEFRDQLMSNKKSAKLKKGIDEVEEYITGGCKAPTSSIIARSSNAKAASKATSKAAAAAAAAADDDEDDDDDAEFDALFSENKKPSSAKKKRQLSADSDKAKKAKKARSDDLAQEEREESPLLSNHSNNKSRTSAVSNFLDRPLLDRPTSPTLIDMSSTSKILTEKDIQPSKLNFGFLGLGIMGSGIVKNLLNSGHSVTVWNRTAEKAQDFVKAGAKEALTPGDVIAEADVTFSCVADPQAAKDMVFGNCGVLGEINTMKGYVEMTGIDADTSQDIAEAISLKGGRYLEAQVQGSKEQSAEGSLVIMVAGDKSLFDDCQSCFQAMGKNSFYLGEVGNASKMNLVLQLMSGVALAGLAEGMALADRAGLQQKDILEVLGLTGLACPMMIGKGMAIIEGGFPTSHPLQHMQKDLKLSLQMGDQLDQPLPLTASANEVFKHAKRLGYGDHDTSAVYIRARF